MFRRKVRDYGPYLEEMEASGVCYRPLVFSALGRAHTTPAYLWGLLAEQLVSMADDGEGDAKAALPAGRVAAALVRLSGWRRPTSWSSPSVPLSSFSWETISTSASPTA